MSYIQPNSTVRLLKGCPLSSDYEHTLYFANTTDQFNYFSSLNGFTLNSQMYQRVDKGIFRCSLPVASVYDCNYMMFKNTSFENFWFYAFIDKIEYLNNGVAEIYFTVDVIQTWFIQKLSLGKCLVEREHSETDNIGEHIEPERIATSEYKANSYRALADLYSDNDMKEYAVIVAVADTDKDVGADGKLYEGVYGGATLYCYLQGDTAGVNNKINEYVKQGRPEAIVAIYLTPQFFIRPYIDSHVINSTLGGRSYSFELPAITTNDTLDGYKPKNNKLYTYPYNFLHVDNSNGSALTLRYEFFKNLKPVLRYSGTITPPVSLMIRPKNYKNIGNALCSETLTITSFPVCSWSYDSYQAWCAQSAFGLATKSIGNVIGSTVGGAMLGSRFGPFWAQVGGVIGLGKGAFNIAQDALTETYSASIKADVLGGNFNSGNANFSQQEQGFNVGRFSIDAVTAKRIDDFFSAYGYSCGKLKVPNISSRPHWNYTKTANCELEGHAPNDDLVKVREIFNNGITFWKHPNEMFNYSLDNSPQ